MDIQQFLRKHKAGIIENGEFASTVFCDHDDGVQRRCDVSSINTCSTSFERQKALFLLGRDYGLKHSSHVHTLSLVSEMWSSYNESFDTPADDPARKEVLCFLTLEADKGEQTMRSVEMIRDVRTDHLIDLVPIAGYMDNAESNLLISFLAGVASAKMNDSELEDFIRQYTS